MLSPPENVLFVVGDESSGKTTLIKQLAALAKGLLIHTPSKPQPTTGRNSSHLTVWQETKISFGKPLLSPVHIEILELGGSISSCWESFLCNSSQATRNGVPPFCALLYVIDATRIHCLPSSTIRFLQLTQPPGDACCGKWPSLVVINKSTAPHAFSLNDLSYFLPSSSESGCFCRSSPSVLEVDSWQGLGMGDVLEWVVATFSRDKHPQQT